MMVDTILREVEVEEVMVVEEEEAMEVAMVVDTMMVDTILREVRVEEVMVVKVEEAMEVAMVEDTMMVDTILREAKEVKVEEVMDTEVEVTTIILLKHQPLSTKMSIVAMVDTEVVVM